MGGKAKPKLADLMKQIELTAKPEKKLPANSKMRVHKSQKDSLDVEIIRVWVSHLVACDFDRVRSIRLAFPTRKLSDIQARGLAARLIVHPMFTDIIAAYIATIEKHLVSSVSYVLNKLYRQAEADIYDYFTEDKQGRQIMRPVADLSKWQRQNVKKLKITNRIIEFMGSKKVTEQQIEIEIIDAFRPVTLLGKNMGMFVEKVEVDFGKDTADRLQAALERVRERRLEGDGHKLIEDQSRSTG